MVSIKWCLMQKNGIELIEPNNNMAESYLKMAEESIKTLNTMMRAAYEISNGFSTLEIYAGRGESSADIFQAGKSLAEGTVKVINRAAREQMQGAYALV